MAIIKCKMCGGDLELTADMTVAECEFCGTKQTVPTADNEKKMTLFARANRLRAACEFDKAAGIYESIVAEFPEEAEAYWGLVLCQYGIEYVDDPATGKKIPTCHRSSFESLMDDSNFEMVMEYSEPTARRVYRDEAKTIEEIRKGIIEVSGREEPYDIFICYKETDFDGNRTLDSVLAQDIYDALTEKGYRVFFARISLEDKLGMEYEPYIFAALNSAKVMLAVGTDYEYYNAVWVKNEWSRFLKLIASGQKKALIPCFKGIDAYDMPKEFARLQAQDLGKIGATQDLLRGIEKILGGGDKKAEVKETTVVQQSSNTDIAPLLKRVFMFLEDGEWNSASEYCEKVLDKDPECAEAYLGKALAEAECATLETFIEKRLDATKDVKWERIAIDTHEEHINAIVEKYCEPGFLEETNIRRFYTVGSYSNSLNKVNTNNDGQMVKTSYYSKVAAHKTQRENEERYWNTHKLLSRALKFGKNEFANELNLKYKNLLLQLDKRIEDAVKRAAASKREAEESYAKFLEETDTKVLKIYEELCARRETRYEEARKLMNDVAVLADCYAAEKIFMSLGKYKDSKELAAQCHQRAEEIKEAEEQARLAAEAAKWEEIYISACEAEAKCKTPGEYLALHQKFNTFRSYKDSQTHATECLRKYHELRDAEIKRKTDELGLQRQREDEERIIRSIKQLQNEKLELQNELTNLRGLFTSKRRKEIETRLAAIETALNSKGL